MSSASKTHELPPHVQRAVDAALRNEQRTGNSAESLQGEKAHPDLPIARGIPVEPSYRSQLEADYADLLEASRIAGEILGWWYEPLTLHLGGEAGTRGGVKYKIDFLVLLVSLELEVRETKGFWRRGERERLKLAAAKFPFRFRAVTREDGVWRYEEFGATRVPAGTKIMTNGNDLFLEPDIA
jgi:hypothetical protein